MAKTIRTCQRGLLAFYKRDRLTNASQKTIVDDIEQYNNDSSPFVWTKIAQQNHRSFLNKRT
jgi:hypothetical protein